jgi:hypothetical protein
VHAQNSFISTKQNDHASSSSRRSVRTPTIRRPKLTHEDAAILEMISEQKGRFQVYTTLNLRPSRLHLKSKR